MPSRATDVTTSQPQRPRNPAPGSGAAAAPTKPLAYTPLKPQRKLFAGLLLVLAIWIAILLTLFFTTVYPRLHTLH